MHSSRQAVYDLLSVIEPHDSLEKEHLDGVLIWVESGADMYRIKKPDVPPKHLVSYFTLYDTKADRFLLVDHRLSGLWLPSGGHVEIDEDPRRTVIRECKEELGIEAEFLSIKPQMVTVTQTIGQGEHIDVSLWYALKGDVEMELDWDEREFKGIKWWSRPEIESYGVENFDPHFMRFIEKIKKEIRE